jgi:hypothetical protein
MERKGKERKEERGEKGKGLRKPKNVGAFHPMEIDWMAGFEHQMQSPSRHH